jgi:transposase
MSVFSASVFKSTVYKTPAQTISGGLTNYRTQRKREIERLTKNLNKKRADDFQKIQELGLKKKREKENLRRIIEIKLPSLIDEGKLLDDEIEKKKRELELLSQKEEEAIIEWLLLND